MPVDAGGAALIVSCTVAYHGAMWVCPRSPPNPPCQVAVNEALEAAQESGLSTQELPDADRDRQLTAPATGEGPGLGPGLVSCLPPSQPSSQPSAAMTERLVAPPITATGKYSSMPLFIHDLRCRPALLRPRRCISSLRSASLPPRRLLLRLVHLPLRRPWS